MANLKDSGCRREFDSGAVRDVQKDECETVQMLTDKRFEEIEQFAELVKPLQQWMLEHYNPHSKIIIECNGATVTTDDMFVPLEVGDSHGQ